jgi:hypothetical protein
MLAKAMLCILNCPQWNVLNTSLNAVNIELTNDYAYLGLILSEFLDFNLTAKIVAKSSNRALGLVMANARQLVVFHMMCLRN